MTHDHRRLGNPGLTSIRTEKGKSKSEQTFQVRISSAFATMREDLESTARETNTYADEIVNLVARLEESHHRKSATFQVLKQHSDMSKEKFDILFSTYSSLLNELAPWRVQVVQAGEEATQVQSARMRTSRKNMISAAKRHLDEGREKQQLVVDASELMKHYKALIMAV